MKSSIDQRTVGAAFRLELLAGFRVTHFTAC
jgi:hypothetical protein